MANRIKASSEFWVVQVGEGKYLPVKPTMPRSLINCLDVLRVAFRTRAAAQEAMDENDAGNGYYFDGRFVGDDLSEEDYEVAIANGLETQHPDGRCITIPGPKMTLGRLRSTFEEVK